MKRIFYLLLTGLCLGCGVSSCTSEFKDLNTNKAGISDEDLEIDYNNLGIPLTVVQQGIYFNYDWGKGKNWPYQLMQNLNADMFSGYMHDYKPLNGGSHNSDYNLQDGWNGTCWENTYAYVFPQLRKSESVTRNASSGFFGITKVLKVLVMHRVSDYYGPIVFTRYGFQDGSSVPDTQEEAYRAFFHELDTAVQMLDHAVLHPQAPESEFANFDLLLDGKYTSWARFANSLRMRLAIRIAVSDPETARQEFTKAFLNPYGVFEDPKEMAAVSATHNYLNPLGVINTVWKEAYMSAPMESILKGYEDPRIEVYFRPCTEDVILTDRWGNDSVLYPLKGQYKGIRQGTCFSHNLYDSHSSLYSTSSSPAILMTAAEVWFLRAEAALRGWTGETVRECYEKGVTTSFAQWNVVGAGEYLQCLSGGADYVDVFDAGNSIEARCHVSPAWMEEADHEIKLEKILTQKWLAVFPEGCEAWAEQRRTGYPRLFPVRFNNSPDRTIDTEIMIRRLPFPGSVRSLDGVLYGRLIQALDAPDHGGTRLWWDTGRNF